MQIAWTKRRMTLGDNQNDIEMNDLPLINQLKGEPLAVHVTSMKKR